MAEKTKYRCTSCNWKFSRNYTPQLCPYCGKATIEVYTATEAEKLLQDLE